LSLNLEIVSPEGSVAKAEVDEVYLPGKLGEFGVLDGHIPFLSALKPGIVRYRVGSVVKRLAISSGFAEVGAGNKVLVLTDLSAERDEVDAEGVQKELAELEAKLKGWTDELTPEHAELLARAAWAQARLEILKEK
jgi:F-type H+-transporting ATPase subunit epsilon